MTARQVRYRIVVNRASCLPFAVTIPHRRLGEGATRNERKQKEEGGRSDRNNKVSSCPSRKEAPRLLGSFLRNAPFPNTEINVFPSVCVFPTDRCCPLPCRFPCRLFLFFLFCRFYCPYKAHSTPTDGGRVALHDCICRKRQGARGKE